MAKASRKKKSGKGPGAAERARRAKQRAIRLAASPEPADLLPTDLKDKTEAAGESREEALHVDSRDWREVKIQGREQEIVDAVQGGDTERAKQILGEVRASAGGCDICSRKPAEGEGFVLSTTTGRSERRWGHRPCLEETADRWLEAGREPVWTPGTSIFTNPSEESVPHTAG
ncbi:MAG TPA: hypothetical protein VHJ78_05355 [Actinomycetota bacterium]|nr:hypothetical protein [Actinomycetota bacterium]